MEKTIAMAQNAARQQESNILKASKAVADALAAGGTVYTFGTGHSHLLAEEIFYRAGGLAKVYPIQDEPLMLHVSATRSSHMERLSGYASLLLSDVRNIQSGGVLFIFANSGRNTVSVDMALCAKEKKLTTVAVTSLNHSQGVTSRHPSGKRLFEVCDIVIDNGGIKGDACMEIGWNMCGPTSTVIGAMIIQAVVCGAVELLVERGIDPEVFSSGNLDGTEQINQKYIDKYRPQIPML